MTEVAQKKGLSKGCMVTLIVTGIVLVVAVALAITCYVKRNDLIKFAFVNGVANLKTEINKLDMPGVDTVAFNAVTDEFIRRVNAEPELNLEQFSTLAPTLQSTRINKDSDSAVVGVLLEAMYSVYPDLKDVYQQNRTSGEEPPEGEMPQDDVPENTEGTAE